MLYSISHIKKISKNSPRSGPYFTGHNTSVAGSVLYYGLYLTTTSQRQHPGVIYRGCLPVCTYCNYQNCPRYHNCNNCPYITTATTVNIQQLSQLRIYNNCHTCAYTTTVTTVLIQKLPQLCTYNNCYNNCHNCRNCPRCHQLSGLLWYPDFQHLAPD